MRENYATASDKDDTFLDIYLRSNEFDEKVKEKKQKKKKRNIIFPVGSLLHLFSKAAP